MAPTRRALGLALGLAAPWLCPAPVPRSSVLAANNAASATGEEQLVIACNGFSSQESTLVGVRKPHGLRPKKPSQLELKPLDAKRQHAVRAARIHEEKALVSAENAAYQRAFLKAHAVATGEAVKAPPTWNLATELVGVIWTRRLGFGECKEFHINLATHELFFVLPGGNATCALKPPGFAEDGDGDDKLSPAEALAAHLIAEAPRHVVAVGAQPHAEKASCEVHTVALPNRATDAALKPAELVTIDAFTQGAPEKPIGAEAEIEEEERLKGLPPLSPLESGAQMRLEDFVEKEVIASEIVGSRTLGLGHAYAVEPKKLHLLLEDIRGAKMIDRADVQFQVGHTYVAMRLGRGGNASECLEKLLFYECKECQSDESWMRRLEEDAEVEPLQE